MSDSAEQVKAGQCDAWWDSRSCRMVEWPKGITGGPTLLGVQRCVMELGHEPLAGLETGHNFGGLGPYTPGMRLGHVTRAELEEDTVTAIPVPPVGAHVRHTTTYTGGTTVTVEGPVVLHADNNTYGAPHIYIGNETDQLVAYLEDAPGGEYSVSLEVLEEPLPPEPPSGTVMQDADGDVWQRRGDVWHLCGDKGSVSWEIVVGNGPLRRLICDPADNAPALPWADGAEGEIEDKIHVSHGGGNVYIHITAGYLRPEEAQLRAAVILRAVREARQA